MKKEYKILSFLFLCTIFLTLSSVSAADIYVNCTGGNDSANGTSWEYAKQTINGGISSTTDGDTLNLANGMYVGKNNVNITINRNLTIIGQNTFGTIINGERVNWILNIANNVNVTIKNLTLTQGKNNAHGCPIYNKDGVINMVHYSGGAIYNNNGSCTVMGCIFTNNAANETGSIFNYPGSYGLQFNGGAINNDDGYFTVIDCTFINNTAFWGGVIYNDNGTCTVNSCTFINNTAIWNGGAIYNDIGGICIVVGSTFTNNTSTQHGNGGAIYNRAGTCAVTGSTFTNNNAPQFGGAIHNDGGTLNVTSSNFTNNTSMDGAIVNMGGTLNVAGSNFTNNTASNVGGAITNIGLNCTVIDCNFRNNNASKYGGAIANASPLTVISSTFIGNVAGTYGSAVYNEEGSANVTFCRIVDNKLNTSQVYNKNGILNALYDWWGSNSNPSIYVNSNVNATLWMVLHISTNPKTISNGSKSTIITSLYYDNLNTYHNPANGHVPDDIPVSFTGTLGNLSLKSTSMINGVANSIFTATNGGLATITAKIDNQTVKTNITVVLPVANANIPSGIYHTTQIIILSMKNASNIYYTINGQNPTTASTRYTVPVYINVSTTLKFFAVDLAGNKSPIYLRNYTIEKTPPKVTSTTPSNNAKSVSLTAPITIKFNENISKSTNFATIYIKNISTGKVAKSTVTSIKGNTVTIKMTMSRLSLNNYQLVIPTGAVKDTAGNNNSKYVLNFKTRKY